VVQVSVEMVGVLISQLRHFVLMLRTQRQTLEVVAEEEMVQMVQPVLAQQVLLLSQFLLRSLHPPPIPL
jgi:hypothetical protein